MDGITKASGWVAARTFVGRQRELTELRAGLDDVLRGHGRLFLIAGEPGIGKTRLAEEVADDAVRRAAQVVWGRCWEGGGAPAYWPMIQVIRGLARSLPQAMKAGDLGAGVAPLAQLVPELRGVIADIPAAAVPISIASAHERFPLFDAATSLLKQAAAVRPVVVILDDLHAADEPSLLWLQFLARELSETRLLVIGTYREVEAQQQPDCALRLSAIARGGRRLSLAGWSESDVSAYIEQGFALHPSTALVVELHRTTEGNPFFVDEVVRVMLADNHARLPDGVGERLHIPPGIREATRQRLLPLPAEAQRLIAVAAVIGQQFDLRCLREVCELPIDRALDLLNAAETAAVVAKESGTLTRYCFTHALIRQTLYEDMPPAERMRLHGRVGSVLESLYGASLSANVAEVAHHFFAAAPLGDAAKAITYNMQAAGRAVSLLAYEEGAAAYARALEALALQPPVDTAQQIEVLLQLGSAHARSGRTVEGSAVFLRAADLARQRGDTTALGRAALGYGGIFLDVPHSGRVDPVLVHLLEEVLAGLGAADSPLRARLLGRWAVELHFSDARDRRAALSKEAIAVARRVGDPATLAYALTARHFALWNLPDTTERLAVANEALRLAHRAGDPDLSIRAHTWRLFDLIEIGDGAGWHRELGLITELADQLRQPRFQVFALTLQAMRATWLGRFDEIPGLTARMMVFADRVADSSTAPSAALLSFVAQRAQWRHFALEPMVRYAVEANQRSPTARCVLALLCADLGQLDEARGGFEVLARDEFRDLQRGNDLDPLLPWLSELCVAVADTARARVLYQHLHRYLDRIIVLGPRVCSGPASYWMGTLAALMEHWEVAETHFEDALRRIAALDGQPMLAMARYEYARMLQARRRPEDAARLVELAAQAVAGAEALGMHGLAANARALMPPPSDVQTRQVAAVGGAPLPASSSSIAGPTSAATEAKGGRVISFPKRRRDASAESPDAVKPARGAPASSPPASDPTEAMFRWEGEFWTVGQGLGLLRLKDSKGLRYLARLLRHPGQEIHAVDLESEAGAGPAPVAAARFVGTEVPIGRAPGGAPLLDAQARGEYTEHLRVLRGELAEATDFNDVGRVAKLNQEIAFLTQELARALGLGGRDRTDSSPAERARVNVTRAIKAVIKRIMERNPTVARYLATTVRTGAFCCYVPDARLPISWKF